VQTIKDPNESDQPRSSSRPGGRFGGWRLYRERRTIAAPDNIRSLTRPPAGSDRGPNGGRLAITRAEAARALGVSINSFERHVQPELRIVRRGKLRLIPVSEIERWLEENAQWTL
jgi:hypothetical protein